MRKMILKANINECTVEGWQSNTAEINVRELSVEMTEDLSSCDNQLVTFELADGTKHESKVTDGKAEIPMFDKPQFIKIGLYTEDVAGDKCEKRYSPRPTNVYVNTGSYQGGSIEPPIPTPSTYADLLKRIEEIVPGGGSSGVNVLHELNNSTDNKPNDVYSANLINVIRKEFGEQLTEIQGDLDEVSALVGGAE